MKSWNSTTPRGCRRDGLVGEDPREEVGLGVGVMECELNEGAVTDEQNESRPVWLYCICAVRSARKRTGLGQTEQQVTGFYYTHILQLKYIV